jgi:UDP-GlcNAc3NAcA epimerase
MRFLSIVGARPQFIKAGPLSLELRKRHTEVLVHTGQHYDREMSDVFFEELVIPKPDYHLGIGSSSHGTQTGEMLARIEGVLEAQEPDAVIVYGDTNSTLAGALAAAKLHVPVAHVEAGLRSFNRAMPEEINRVIADHVSSWLFAPSDSARDQLAREGIEQGVHVVGDIMMDALRYYTSRPKDDSPAVAEIGLSPGEYYLATVHRAENTDEPTRLRAIISALGQLDKSVVMPLHPRTRKRLQDIQLEVGSSIRVIEPQSYLRMLELQRGAVCILTDSGGVQKEAYYLGVPCVTLRDETEWTETLDTGWNVLAGADQDRILQAIQRHAQGHGPRPELYGDGYSSQRIVAILEQT